MASKRKLKKTMYFISSQLISDIFFKSMILEKDISEKADELVMEISRFTREHVNRIGRNGGKDRKEVKSYYRKLYADWNEGMDKFVEKVSEL